MNKSEIYYYLRSRIPRDHETVLARVDELRSSAGLDRVNISGLLTLSSYCIRDCIYCGHRAGYERAGGFRLSRSQIIESAEKASKAGIKFFILKSGYDPGFGADAVAELVRDLKNRFGLFITLAMGEQERASFDKWKRAGADAYWIRHETCDPHLYRRIKPSMYWVDRIRSIEALKQAGFPIGTGILIGMPNQSFESVVEDLLLFSDPAIFAVSIEPYNPPPDSPGYELVQRPENLILEPDPPTMEKLMAITRIFRNDILISLTNAHQELYRTLGKKDFFRAGANSIVLDFTPAEYSGFESLAPFSGIPISERGGLDAIRQSLADMGLKADFDPPKILKN